MDVQIQNFAFAPADITVPVGTTVRWQNFDNVAHTVTSVTPAGVLDSGALVHDQSFEYQFTQPGVYSYHCSFHPSMTGTVTVVERVFLPAVMR